MTRIAVITAVAAERDAVARGVGIADHRQAGPYESIGGQVRGDAELVVVAAGVGPAAAAAAAMAVALGGVDVLFSAGVAGSFAGRAEIGDIVVATSVVAADLGAHSPSGFADLAALGFGTSAYAVDEAASAHTAERLAAAGLPARRGAILTVSAATGTDERAGELAARHDAIAEAMEGAGVAHVASLLAIPLVELRAISNIVGVRNPAAWDLPRALAALERAMRALFARQ
jgi:futalosine hydrolase